MHAFQENISDWTPPTPQSVLVPVATQQQKPLPSLALPDATLATRRPPSPDSEVQVGQSNYRKRPTSELARLLNPETDPNRHERATPNNIGTLECAGAISEYFQDLQQSSKQRVGAEDIADEAASFPSNDDDEEQDPSYTSSESRKRPRREAAVTAARLIPRQPSPFELSPPPSRSRSGPGAQSNRKVSHSLIERRRRERINDCLSHLKRVVPHCRAEGEKKVARAKERGRKRGRKGDEDGGDDGQRGGLHKLEILQGTIRYVEELEARVTAFEHRLRNSDVPSVFTESTTASPSAEPTPSHLPIHLPTPTEAVEGIQVVFKSCPHLHETSEATAARSSLDEATAELLLNLSTSPELRPIVFE